MFEQFLLPISPFGQGCGATIIRDVPFGMVYFPAYNNLKVSYPSSSFFNWNAIQICPIVHQLTYSRFDIQPYKYVDRVSYLLCFCLSLLQSSPHVVTPFQPLSPLSLQPQPFTALAPTVSVPSSPSLGFPSSLLCFVTLPTMLLPFPSLQYLPYSPLYHHGALPLLLFFHKLPPSLTLPLSTQSSMSCTKSL